MEKQLITRFAPSPTGLLHVGNVRTALVAWLFARQNKGEFILRIDDTDIARSTTEFEDQIKIDLRWLGITWDKTLNQKDRLDRYEEVKTQLLEAGILYPCYETQEELEIKRSIQMNQGLPPIYDRSALKMTQGELKEFVNEGRSPHYRFKLSDKPVSWNDLVRGETKFETLSTSDPIFIREDGSWTYMACSVIDDIDLNITHIIRGDDHVSNTVSQILLFEALGATTPLFGHLPRIASKDAKISKRIGGFDIKTLRETKGIEAMTINNFLASIGTCGEPSTFIEMSGLINAFDITKFKKSPTTYTEEDLLRINHKILAQINFDQIKNDLERFNLKDIDEQLWLACRSNLEKLVDIEIWINVCKTSLKPEIKKSDEDFLLNIIQFLPEENDWDENTWTVWINTIKPNTDRTGKEIFMPIRMALTGLSHGPELKLLLPIIGKERVKKTLIWTHCLNKQL